ncbi:MAG TPA: hypothetical protein VML55_06570 [Planctomycetaceae bacterium]|nr:hypothetical protein [Planctomycetaceae bacterium]
MAPGDPAFDRTWSRTDLPVASNTVSRTWMWGPAAFTSPMIEWMTDNPGNGRMVQYFDKSRMEITDPGADPSSIWYVTNGLLARELVTGNLQHGLNDFEQREPAEINAAGDSNDPNAPAYASFQLLLDAAPLDEGQLITTRIDRAGNLTDDPALSGQGIAASEYVAETNHRVAAPFWEFMTASGLVYQDGENVTAPLFETPFFATGLPITEAYWARVNVSGIAQDVLIQVFERRVLTYTPENAPEWRVEAGNVGRHYYEWRYGAEPPNEPPATAGGTTAIGPTPLPSLFAHDGLARLTIANNAPQPLVVTLEGPESRTVDLPACEGCESTSQPPASCSPNAPSTTIDIPPGTYLVTSQRPESDALPLSGPWTFVPDAGYGACFFVVTDG